MNTTIKASAAVLLAGTLALTSGCGDKSTPTASAPATTAAAASPSASPTPPPDAGPALAKAQVDLPHANTDGSNVVYGFSAFDYGKPVSVTKPAGRIVEMPAETYK